MPETIKEPKKPGTVTGKYGDLYYKIMTTKDKKGIYSIYYGYDNGLRVIFAMSLKEFLRKADEYMGGGRTPEQQQGQQMYNRYLKYKKRKKTTIIEQILKEAKWIKPVGE